MRNLLSLTLASLLLTHAAWAHGGGGFRGPNGGVPPGLREPTDPEPPPPPPEDPGASVWSTPPASPPCGYCAMPACLACSADYLKEGNNLAVRNQQLKVLRSWGDVMQVEVTLTFQSKKGTGPIEAYAPVWVEPLFAPTAAWIRNGEQTLTASLAASASGRERYIKTKNKKLDPLLLSRRSSGEYALRAFPVTEQAPTVVTIRGFTLVDRTPRRVRVYRTKERYLVVTPLRFGKRAPGADLVDPIRGRALHFVSQKEARRRFGPLAVWSAREVPCVTALERACRGGEKKVWVALEPRPPTPPPVIPRVES